MKNRNPLWLVLVAASCTAALTASIVIIGSRFVETGWRNEWPTFFAAWMTAAATISAILIANWHVGRIEDNRVEMRKRQLLRSLYEWSWAIGNQCWVNELNLRSAMRKNEGSRRGSILAALRAGGVSRVTSAEVLLAEIADIDPLVYRTLHSLIRVMGSMDRILEHFLPRLAQSKLETLEENCKDLIGANVNLRIRAMRACIVIGRHLPSESLEVRDFKLTPGEQAKMDKAGIESSNEQANPFPLKIGVPNLKLSTRRRP